MRVAMMTREYPPEVYGGAGVHVTELVAKLRHLCEVDVHCMGAPRPGVTVAQPDPALQGANAAYVEDMQAEYERNPGSVGDEWRHFFESLKEERSGAGESERGPS